MLMPITPGHGQCFETAWEATEISTWAMGGAVRVEYSAPRCLHLHTEPIQADDGLGTGPIVADHCRCCNTITPREDYT